MDNFLIIGNSHTYQLCKAISKDPIVKKPHASYNIDNFTFLWKYGKLAYNIDYNIMFNGFENILDSIDNTWTILPFFGSVDIRAHINKNDNVIDTADGYFSNTLDFFKKSGGSVRFIEPVPPTITTFFERANANFFTDFPVSGSISKRLEIHELFINRIKENSKKYGIKNPITDIYPSKPVKKQHSLDGDHLSPKSNIDIYEKIKNALA